MRPIPTNPLKHRQINWLWFVLVTVLLIVIIPLLPSPYRNTEVLIGAIGGLWGLAFFLQNGHKENAQFMKELFEYFNKRYDDQNNNLQNWLGQKGEFNEDQKLGFIDYFNLCAEESVFQKLGYIYDEVWESWLNGMRQYGRDPRVAALWAEQRKTTSYYGFEFPLDHTEVAEYQFHASIDNALVLVTSGKSFDPETADFYCRTLTKFKAGGYPTIAASSLEGRLQEFWLSGKHPAEPPDQEHEAPSGPVRRDRRTRYRITAQGPKREWFIKMSEDFIKAIQRIDRKLQGRILEALAVISRNPLSVSGDTVKPLTHDMKGLWRYRLGDYRLVYQPLPEVNQVLLVDFDSRGSVYG